MSVRHRPRVTLLLSFVCVVASSPVAAGTIGLAWDPVSDTDLDGYRIYYGTSAGNYTAQIDLATVTQHTLAGLADCTTWFVSVKAFDTSNQESDAFSNEVSGWARPTVVNATPSRGEQGQRLDILVTGTNFQPGATVELSSPDVQVHSVTVSSCSELVADVTLGSGAATGPIDIDVINPDQVFGSGTGVFTVDIAPTPPAVLTQPQGRTVTEGQSVVFSVAADGTAPLSYQWKRNGTDISGATGDRHTLDRAAFQDDGTSFSCVVSNAAGSTETDPALLGVNPSGTRVTDGLIVLYTFEEGQGATVTDRSGVGAPLDLTLADAAAATWIESGLTLDSSTILDSGVAATKVVDAAQASGEISVEAWVRPADTLQDGPAGIVSLSANASARNFTLGQRADTWDVRLRSTTTTDNGIPSLQSPSGSLDIRVFHVVFTHNVSGAQKIFIDGVETAALTAGGDLTGWNDLYHLLVANEAGGDDRPWLGDLNLVAIYDRALDPAEIDQNRDAGPYAAAPPPPDNEAPIASFTVDAASGVVPLTVNFDASGSSDPDGSIVSWTWNFGDGGTGNGVNPTHVYTSVGTYTATLTVVDDREESDTTTRTIVVTAEPPPGQVLNLRRGDARGN
jgi:PKD repeat protein